MNRTSTVLTKNTELTQLLSNRKNRVLHATARSCRPMGLWRSCFPIHTIKTIARGPRQPVLNRRYGSVKLARYLPLTLPSPNRTNH
jgi:hypothetical protein